MSAKVTDTDLAELKELIGNSQKAIEKQIETGQKTIEGKIETIQKDIVDLKIGQVAIKGDLNLVAPLTHDRYNCK